MQNLGGKQSVLWAIGKQSMPRFQSSPKITRDSFAYNESRDDSYPQPPRSTLEMSRSIQPTICVGYTKKKKKEKKKSLHFQNLARLRQPYQLISSLTSICYFPTVLSPTFQYAPPYHENYQERGRMQSSRSSHFTSNSKKLKNSAVLITRYNISIPCFRKVQYFYSFFIHHMFFFNHDHNIF